MGIVREIQPAALIAGIIFSDSALLAEAMEILTGRFGPVEMESTVFDFDMTDYYNAEMGDKLKKRFICFTNPFSLENMPETKLMTNRIETGLARSGEGQLLRSVNIDPGYVTLSKLVLATTKDYSHRVFIGKGIFAETTLRYVKGTFAPIDTTYPDYRTPLAIDFFNEVRDFVKRNITLWNLSNESKN